MSSLSKNRISVLIITLGTMVACSGMAINTVIAAPSGGVTGSGTVQFTCGDLTRTPTLTIDFEALRGEGKTKLQGSFELRDTIGGVISGDVDGGKVGKKSFSLLVNYLEHIGICPNDTIPSSGTISATCGQSSDLVLKFENGAEGVGTGDFSCSK